MKIAINQQPYDGPWGGGNRFLQTIVADLLAYGHVVTYDLSNPVDIIVMVETRTRSPNVTFGAGAILRYLVCHPGTLVVHRINECDERKGEKFITHKLLRANYAADFTVFVGSWLTRLSAWKNQDKNRQFVILNGSDKNVFNANGFKPWNGTGPIKLVTHHWGAHRFKGFDVYERIDNLLEDLDFKSKFSMTYIGNLPKDYIFKNIRHVSALNGQKLADELRSHHGYITGSINEPGGNHQNEGALCGLPIIYRNSGCMPEYCDGFGISYEGVQDVTYALDDLYHHYESYADKVKSYPHNADKTAKEWRSFFEDIIERRQDIIGSRKIFRNPYLLLRNQIPL